MEMYVAFLVGSPLMSEAQIWDELALHVRNDETQLHLGRRMPKVTGTPGKEETEMDEGRVTTTTPWARKETCQL